MIIDGRMLGGTASDFPDPHADPEALAALLERIRGSVAYLRDAGVTADELARMRDRLALGA